MGQGLYRAIQGYTGVEAAVAEEEGVNLFVVNLEEAERGFVLFPKRWVVERLFAGASRFRRLALVARD